MRRTPVTSILIGLNVAAFVVTTVKTGFEFAPGPMIRLGADVGILTLGGQWWRLASSLFLHFGLLHIGSNMICLYSLGRKAEQALGSWVLLLAYLIAGIAGNLASVTIHPDVVSAGASGAVFGLAGLLLPIFTQRSGGKAWEGGPSAESQSASVVAFAAYNLLFSLAPGIDATAHLGGFGAGVALGFALRSPLGSERPARRLAITLVASAVFLVGGATGGRAYRKAELPDIGEVVISGDSIGTVPAAPALPDITELERRLRKNPDSASAYVALAGAYGSVGSVQEAVAVLRRGLQRQPRNVVLLTALGSAEVNTGDFSRAIVAFDRALTLSPENADLRYNLATALFDRAQSEAGRPTAADSVKADVRRILALPADTSLEMNALRLAARDLEKGPGPR